MENLVMVFKSVHQLSLVGNLIATGSEIDNLRDYFPGLSSLYPNVIDLMFIMM
jgi:hypothetical protein